VASVRYFASARAAAGHSEETVNAATVNELVKLLSERHGDRLAQVLSASSFLVDGLACHDRDAELGVGSTVDVLPPFAGG
jgi:molybdopterin converting factor small subunit